MISLIPRALLLQILYVPHAQSIYTDVVSEIKKIIKLLLNDRDLSLKNILAREMLPRMFSLI